MNLRDTIIHESLKLFSLKGFMSTSLSDILSASGSSKGGFYNHFASKEELFLEVLAEAKRIWRKKVLYNLGADSPLQEIKTILLNYRDRYLKDGDNFPGGCIFITLSVELDDQLPHLGTEITQGFTGFKRMLRRLLDAAKERGELGAWVDANAVTDMLFSGMLGASVMYGADKSTTALDRSINSLIAYLEQLEKEGSMMARAG